MEKLDFLYLCRVMGQLCVSVCNKTLGEKLFLRNALFVFIRLSFQEKFQPC